MREKKFPRVRGPRVHSSSGVMDPKKLGFKVTGTKPSLRATAPKPLNLRGLGGQGERRGFRVGGRASLSLQMQVLEMLSRGPSPITDLRGDLRVSRSALARLVRRGMLKVAWGRKGVGLFYGITQNGLEELKRLKAVSTVRSRGRKVI